MKPGATCRSVQAGILCVWFLLQKGTGDFMLSTSTLKTEKPRAVRSRSVLHILLLQVALELIILVAVFLWGEVVHRTWGVSGGVLLLFAAHWLLLLAGFRRNSGEERAFRDWIAAGREILVTGSLQDGSTQAEKGRMDTPPPAATWRDQQQTRSAVLDLLRTAVEGREELQELAQTYRNEIRQLKEALSDANGAADFHQKALTDAQQKIVEITEVLTQLSGAGRDAESELLVVDGSMQAMQESAAAAAGDHAEQKYAADLEANVAALMREVDSTRSVFEQGSQAGTAAADQTSEGEASALKMIHDMNHIEARIQQSVDHVNGLQKYSDEIDRIVHTIDDIADQTNLLALNAAIEAARAESQSLIIGETLLQNHLLGTASLLADMLVIRAGDVSNEELMDLAERARVENISFSNEDGVLVASNMPEADIGFRYPEDEKDFWYPLRALIHQDDGEVAFPIMPRSSDNVPFMYVAVSRRDQPGAVQAAASGESVTRFSQNTRGFAVVAGEVRKLAEETLTATKEVRSQITTIQKAAHEGVQAMALSADAVQNGATQAEEVNRVLQRIRESIENARECFEDGTASVEMVSRQSKDLQLLVQSARVMQVQDQHLWSEIQEGLRESRTQIRNLAGELEKAAGQSRFVRSDELRSERA